MVDQYGRWYPDYPGQQPYQDPSYMRAAGQHTAQPIPNGQVPVNTPQDMTPTIRAEIKQVESIEAIDNVPLGAGTSQMFMTKDEKNIVIRSVFANGQHTDKIYDERPPAPPAPKFDPAVYVRRDEIGDLVNEAISARIAASRQQTEGK